MDRLHVIIALLSGVVCSNQELISGSILEVTVRPGDNITLYCDRQLSTGVAIVWYRNCSHENQPTLNLKTRYAGTKDFMNPFPRFHLSLNQSSISFDLLLTSISTPDEGLYYCGIERIKFEGKTKKTLFEYGNVITRITLTSSARGLPECWMMAITPAFTVFSSFISFVLVYHICQRTEPGHQKRHGTRGQTNGNQGEDDCLTQVVFWAQDGKTHLLAVAEQDKDIWFP